MREDTSGGIGRTGKRNGGGDSLFNSYYLFIKKIFYSNFIQGLTILYQFTSLPPSKLVIKPIIQT